MRRIDALRINRLLAPMLTGRLAIDDEGAFEAAVDLAADARLALSCGLGAHDVTANWSDRPIALGWLNDDDELTCQCGCVQSADDGECDRCGLPLVLPETVTARLTDGVVVCGRCFGGEFALDVADGTARPMVRNEGGRVEFSDRATIASPRARLAREYVGVPRIVCTNPSCGTVVKVPDYARLAIAEAPRRRRWLPGERRRRATP
jgi:hypothetical protein